MGPKNDCGTKLGAQWMRERRVAKPKHKPQDSMVVKFFEEDSTVYNRALRSGRCSSAWPTDHDLRRPRPDTGLHLAGSPVHHPASGSSYVLRLGVKGGGKTYHCGGVIWANHHAYLLPGFLNRPHSSMSIPT